MFVELRVRGRPLASHSSAPCCLAQKVEAPRSAEPNTTAIFQVNTAIVGVTTVRPATWLSYDPRNNAKIKFNQNISRVLCHAHPRVSGWLEEGSK